MPDGLQSKFDRVVGRGKLSRAGRRALTPKGSYGADFRKISGEDLRRVAAVQQVSDPDALYEALVEIRRLERELRAAQKKLVTDYKTGLCSRKGLDIHVEAQIKGAARFSAPPFSVISIDLCLFKDVNDLYGSDAGDAALRAVGKYLKKHCRPGDIVARDGGDEFYILLPNCDEAGAKRVMERIYKKWEEFSFRYGGHALTVGINMGVACYKAGEDAKSFLGRAEKVMKAAKEADSRRKGRARPTDGAAVLARPQHLAA